MTSNSFFKRRKMFAGFGFMTGIGIMVITISLFLLPACNSNPNSQDTNAKNNINHETKVFDNDEVKPDLNNGIKWKVDSATDANFRVLQNIAEQDLSHDINECHQRGKQLQAGIDKMIKECRMGGPEHEALHHWLEPLIENIRQLQQAESVNHALEIHSRIKSQIASFSDIFE